MLELNLLELGLLAHHLEGRRDRLSLRPQEAACSRILCWFQTSCRRSELEVPDPTPLAEREAAAAAAAETVDRPDAW